jgi:hypothetical protein
VGMGGENAVWVECRTFDVLLREHQYAREAASLLACGFETAFAGETARISHADGRSAALSHRFILEICFA